MNSTEVACGLRASALKSPPHLQAVLGLANLQTTIALQVNNYWLGGKPLFVSHPNDYSFGYETTTDSMANNYCYHSVSPTALHPPSCP